MIAVNKMKMISHARTVVQECCKGDDESQWERGKFDPRTQKPLNRWSPKFVYVTTSGISTTMQNFIQIGWGVSVLHMRDFAPFGTKWLGYFLGGSWERLQPRRAQRFWRKIRQPMWFHARKCLLGVAKPKYKATTPIFPQNRHFGAPFWRDWIFWTARE